MRTNRKMLAALAAFCFSGTLAWGDGYESPGGSGGGAPGAHATSHQDGGSDEIDVTGLTGACTSSGSANDIQINAGSGTFGAYGGAADCSAGSDVVGINSAGATNCRALTAPDGGVTSLTCSAATQGKIQVLDGGLLEYCDGAATSVIHRAALADTSGNALSGDTVTSFFPEGTTGSGAVVQATSPTLVTPEIGAATGTSLAATTFVAAGADPADAGAIRLSNGGSIKFESSPAGTDITAFNQDSSEQMAFAENGSLVPTITFFGATAAAGAGAANTIQFTNTGTIIVEGTTADTNQVTIDFGDPAAASTVSVPTGATDTLVARTSTDTLTNKTVDGASNDIQLRRHATDCTGLTDGVTGEACYEQDADTLYVCEPTAGACDTAGEWRQVAGAGGSGDITDVWGCASGDCSTLTAASGDSLDAGSATSIAPAVRSATLPGTCTEGWTYHDTDSGGTEWYVCTATDTWTKTVAATDNVATATALAANGANCSAGSAPLGVDASGAVESCTDYEEDLSDSAGLRGALSDESGTGAAIFAGGDVGAATATTPSSNDSDTSVATTAFVQNELDEAWEIRTRAKALDPCAAENAQQDTRNNHPVLDFEDGTATTRECGCFEDSLPLEYGGNGLTATLFWAATSATSNAVVWEGYVERQDDDAVDLDSDSFASAQTVTATTASVSGEIAYDDITFTSGAQMDSLVAGERFRFKVCRDADNASDNLSGDAELWSVRIRETP